MHNAKRATQLVVFTAGLLTLWALASRLGPWPRYLLPGPQEVGGSLVRLVQDGRLGPAVLKTMLRLMQGYLISLAVGVPLGIALARSEFLRTTVKPLVMGLQALPSICWMPLAILWFGLSENAILFVVVMGSLLAISISSEDGVNGIQPQLIQAAGTLGIKGSRFWFGVLIPGALPGIVTGAKLGWSFAWRALMAGELLFVSGGLGQLLTEGRELLDVAQVMAVMMVIVAVGVATDKLLFRTIEMKVRRRWGLLAAA